VKSAVMRFLFIFVKLGLNPDILSCFAPNLTPVCERCVLTIHIILMFFLCGAATINFTFSFNACFDYNHLE
jgi:hypothetical protein